MIDVRVSSDRPLYRPLKPQEQLVLLHIPKTAGSTLTSIVDTNFDVKDIFPEATIGRYSPEELQTYRLFRGHFDYNIHRFFKEKPSYITILRDPIDRAISLYEFWKRARDRNQPDSKPMAKILQDATLEGLEGFICHSDPQIKSRTSNRQVRQLAIGIGGLSPDPSADFSDDELLAMAKKNLDDCLFVGLTERFQDSAFLLAYIFGWYPIADYQSLRVASKRSRKEGIAPEILDAIASVNQLDLELYEYGKQRFQTDYAQMINELKATDETLNQTWSERLISGTATSKERIDCLLSPLEHHYERCYAEHPPAEPVDTYDFTCLQPIFGAGWHRRNGKNNGLITNDISFRWTGPGTVSTMDLALKRNQDLSLRVHIINTIAPDVLDSFTLRVNGHDLTLSPLVKRSNRAILQGLIQQEWLECDRPFVRLEFEVNRTASPQSVNPKSPDTRFVGLALHRLQIFPVGADMAVDQFTYLKFPTHDPHWTDVSDFLNQHLKEDERLAAMGEFSTLFPQQFCSLLEPFHQSNEKAHDQVEAMDWVVIHKGEYQNHNADAIEWTVKTLHPVFANSVFVVYSNRTDIPALSPWSNHVMSLSGRMGVQHLEEMGILPPKTKNTFTKLAKKVMTVLRMGG